SERKMTFASWKGDRAHLFTKKPTVAMDELAIETWHGGKTKEPLVVATFVQRWKSKKTADHGKKAITLRVDGDRALIVREEMLSAALGWDDQKVETVDATSLGASVTTSLAWARIAGCKATADDEPCAK